MRRRPRSYHLIGPYRATDLANPLRSCGPIVVAPEPPNRAKKTTQITEHEGGIERFDLAASNVAGVYSLRRAGTDIRVEQCERGRSHHAQFTCVAERRDYPFQRRTLSWRKALVPLRAKGGGGYK